MNTGGNPLLIPTMSFLKVGNVKLLPRVKNSLSSYISVTLLQHDIHFKEEICAEKIT